MSTPDNNRTATERLRRDVRDWAAAHVELARTEAAEAGRAVGGLGLRWGMAYTVVVVGLSTAAVGTTLWLAGRFNLLPHLTAILVGLALVAVAVVFTWLTYRRFRSEFTAFEQTVEELREDVTWLREHFIDDGADDA
jgi:uncharacterized membrane protein YqjE